MANSGGIITASVNMKADVEKLLYGTQNGKALSVLCTDRNKINMWSKKKPVRWSGTTRRTDWWKADDQDCGIDLNNSVFHDAIKLVEDWMKKAPSLPWQSYWMYKPPTGGTYPYRLLDFNSYKHKQSNEDNDKPLSNFAMDREIEMIKQGGVESLPAKPSISIRPNALDDYLLTFDDMNIMLGAGEPFSLDNYYFGVAIATQVGNDWQYAFLTSSWKFNENAQTSEDESSYGYNYRSTPSITTKTMPYYNNQTYYVFPMLSSVQCTSDERITMKTKTQRGGSFSPVAGCTFIPLPYNGIEVLVKPQAVWFKASARIYKQANATTVVAELDITNVSTESHEIDFADVWCVLKVIPRTSGGGLNLNANVREYTHRFFKPTPGTYTYPAGYSARNVSSLGIDYTEYSPTYGDQFELTLYSDNGNIEAFSPSPLVYDPTQPAIVLKITDINDNLLDNGTTLTLSSSGKHSFWYWVSDQNRDCGVNWSLTHISHTSSYTMNLDVYGRRAEISGTNGLSAYLTCTLVDGSAEAYIIVDFSTSGDSGDGGGSTAVTGVSLDMNTMELGVGKSKYLTETVLPDAADDKTVYWTTSNDKVATVNAVGMVTGLKVGRATITVHTNDGNKTASCIVNVTQSGGGSSGGGSSDDIRVESVTISPDIATVLVNSSMTLTAKVKPKNAKVTSVVWAIVSGGGYIKNTQSSGLTYSLTGKSGGTAVIKVTINNQYIATKDVRVTTSSIAVTSISLNPPSATIGIGGTLTPEVSFNPPSATDRTITWSSSDSSKATVDSNGLIVGRAVGTATITARTSNGKTATCVVTVNRVYVTSIDISPYSFNMNKGGDYVYMSATVEPVDATDKSLSWHSSDENIIKIGIAGVVYACGEGDARIWATANDRGIVNSPEAYVHVTDLDNVGKIPVESVEIVNIADVKQETYSVPIGQSIVLKPMVYPLGANPYTVTWDTSDRNGSYIDIEPIDAERLRIYGKAVNNENIYVNLVVSDGFTDPNTGYPSGASNWCMIQVTN